MPSGEIGATASLTGYGGGLDRKRWLLPLYIDAMQAVVGEGPATAAIVLVEGDKLAAIAAATKAYKAAWCDGPPYAYHWGLEQAKTHLASLGAPEPDMPPFDESKFEPLPEVEINPKDEYWVDADSLD